MMGWICSIVIVIVVACADRAASVPSIPYRGAQSGFVYLYPGVHGYREEISVPTNPFTNYDAWHTLYTLLYFEGGVG